MNERLKQLCEQTGLEFDDDLALEPEPIYYTTQKDLEKFAELIVAECINICGGHARDDGTAQRIIEDIKKYFVGKA